MASVSQPCIIHILILFLVLCSCITQNRAAFVTSSIDTDKEALMFIRSQTITVPSDALAMWHTNSSACSWTRVLCDNHGQRVIGLDLSKLQISGQVSPYIGNLSFLRSLQLQENQFDSILPETLTSLVRLRVLNISFNIIQGIIPANISRCIELRVIDFMQNELFGWIPQDISLLVNLQTLILARNHLSGSIPPSIANLSSLSTLRLGTNTLGGPIPGSFSRLLNLKVLDLTINNLTGTVPPSIYNMSSLEILAVASNDLWGDIPYNVGETLPNLIDFNFCINRFTGAIPGSLHNITNIKIIRMAHNRLHGTVPPGLGSLPELVMYNIGYNNIVSLQGEGLSFINSLVNSTKLDFLAVDGNHFDGIIPESIGNFSKQLRILYMGSNRISGSIPHSIGQLQGLALLNISNNFISGEIPSEIGQLGGLQELVLGKNRLTSNIPSSLGNLRRLAHIDLSSNEFIGSIPVTFRNFERLTSMDLSMNKLNGSLPGEVLDLPSLTTILNLSANSLTGSLPREIGNLERVVAIDLSNNHFSGDIPNSIQNCKSLEQLIISKNSFSGNIPNSLGELKGLTTLDLSSNQLSGPIPLVLQNLNTLEFLNISFNKLEGKVPNGGIFSNLTRVQLEGNPKLCYDSKCSRSDTNKVVIITVVVISSGLVMLISIALFFYLKKKKIATVMENSNPFKGQHHIVTYDHLRWATGDFHKENLIGRGSFGSVYKGCLKLEGQIQVLAVKVLDMETSGSIASFLAECAALRHLRHRNLVKLITSCSSLDHKNNEFVSLIYEYMENGSLEKWIPNGMGLLERVNVAVDIACGLCYLHHECVVAPVVHCDLKPSNVLLDEDLTAKIGDFGLASMLVETTDQSFSSADVLRGSMGYIPPEYGMGSKPSTKGDVYSFGIMLMEIFTGKNPTDESFVGGLNIKTWVQSAYLTNLDQVLDSAILQEADDLFSDYKSMSLKIRPDCLKIVMEVAVSCTNDSPEARITIYEALHKLKSVQDMFHKSTPSESQLLQNEDIKM